MERRNSLSVYIKYYRIRRWPPQSGFFFLLLLLLGIFFFYRRPFLFFRRIASYRARPPIRTVHCRHIDDAHDVTDMVMNQRRRRHIWYTRYTGNTASGKDRLSFYT